MEYSFAGTEITRMKNLATSEERSAIVTLVKKHAAYKERIVVGVVLRPGAPSEGYQFDWASQRRPLVLRYAPGFTSEPPESRFCTCMLGALFGVNEFRTSARRRFGCKYSVLQGWNLPGDDCGTGFHLAALMAVAAAIGTSRAKYKHRLDAHGYIEYHKPAQT